MKCALLFLAISILVTLLSAFRKSGNKPNVRFRVVPNVNGKCKVKNKNRENHEVWYNKKKCEKFTCMVDDDFAFLLIRRCIDTPKEEDIPQGCELLCTGKGKIYPECCEYVIGCE
ncbi:U-scoloptoxin(16)-Er10a-like [Centruroides vittatus]|uniref:uncharacterized protein LOC111622469 n=1 Tax=Centruroides sculpturatus TaxID=218467 RepID=UPI000C6C9211|nr:uncharacterized protein LOC111622469 [Centruroides sculpturatus]